MIREIALNLMWFALAAVSAMVITLCAAMLWGAFVEWRKMRRARSAAATYITSVLDPDGNWHRDADGNWRGRG